MAMIIIICLLLLICSGILLLKLAENVDSTLWAFQFGATRSTAMYRAIAEWRKEPRGKPSDLEEAFRAIREMWDPQTWLFTRYIWHQDSANRVAKVFRNPILMAAQCVVLVVSVLVLDTVATDLGQRWPIIFCVGVALFSLWIGAWVGLMHVLITRLTLGFIALRFPRMGISVKSHTEETLDQLVPARRVMLWRIVEQIAGLVGIILAAYGCVYFALDWLSRAMGYGAALNGLSNSWKRPIECLYFSIVTLGTVGYGDICPGKGHVVAQLAVASEVIAGQPHSSLS